MTRTKPSTIWTPGGKVTLGKDETLDRVIYPYQGLEDDDNRMVINGVVPSYAEARQQEFWKRG